MLPPVAEERITKLEEQLAVALPLEYRISLCVHEGTAEHVWLWNAVSLSKIGVVVDDWTVFLEMSSPSHRRNQGAKLKSQGPVRTSLFDQCWIPIASDNGIPICLDLNPLPGGIAGQVIYVDWEDGTVRVIANGFAEFLADGLKKMRST